MKAQGKIGRPSKGYGPRHTVAVQLTPEEFETLQKMTADMGVKPGPYLTELAQAHIDSMRSRHFGSQEALSFDKAS